MKEIISTSVNFSVIEGESGPIGMTEIILVTSEPVHTETGRDRVADNFRFSAGAKGLRGLAKALVKYAEYAESLEKRTTIEKEKL